MVFEPSVIRDLLSDNWTAGNVDNTTPSFYFTGGDITAQTLANGDAILIYEVAMPTNRPKGLGYDGESREVVLAVDIRTQRGSDRMEKLRNEVNRIRKAKRKNPRLSRIKSSNSRRNSKSTRNRSRRLRPQGHALESSSKPFQRSTIVP